MLGRDVMARCWTPRADGSDSDQPQRGMRLGGGELLLERLECTTKNVGFGGVEVSRESLESGTVWRIQVYLNGFSHSFPLWLMSRFHDLMIRLSLGMSNTALPPRIAKIAGHLPGKAEAFSSQRQLL